MIRLDGYATADWLLATRSCTFSPYELSGPYPGSLRKSDAKFTHAPCDHLQSTHRNVRPISDRQKQQANKYETHPHA